jgi:hypothetical protein
MQSKVKGERIALTPVPDDGTYLPFTLPLVVSTHVSGISDRRLLLQLDSGIDVHQLRGSLCCTGAVVETAELSGQFFVQHGDNLRNARSENAEHSATIFFLHSAEDRGKLIAPSPSRHNDRPSKNLPGQRNT